MTTPALLTACGFVDESGFGSDRRRTAWQTPSGGPPEVLQWRTLSENPFDHFGRLDPLCQYAAVAVEMLDLEPPAAPRAHTGITLGTTYGCVAVDMKFYETATRAETASPLLFVYTLPSTAIAEIAIRHRITGPNACYMALPRSGLLALWEGVRLIESGEAQQCVAIAGDVAPPLDGSPKVGFAYAFLIEATPGNRGALAEITIAPADAPKANGKQSSENRTVRALLDFAADSNEASGTLAMPAPAALKSSDEMVFTR